MKEQLMNLSIEELVRQLPRFGGGYHEDIIQWLHDIKKTFDQAPLGPSNKYLAVQCYLTAGAAAWFRYNKSTICDWFTFKIEIVKAFQSSLDTTLLMLDQPQQSSPISTSLIMNSEQDAASTSLDVLNADQIEVSEKFIKSWFT
jgi:hypothetical protein